MRFRRSRPTQDGILSLYGIKFALSIATKPEDATVEDYKALSKQALMMNLTHTIMRTIMFVGTRRESGGISSVLLCFLSMWPCLWMSISCARRGPSNRARFLTFAKVLVAWLASPLPSRSHQLAARIAHLASGSQFTGNSLCIWFLLFMSHCSNSQTS